MRGSTFLAASLQICGIAFLVLFLWHIFGGGIPMLPERVRTDDLSGWHRRDGDDDGQYHLNEEVAWNLKDLVKTKGLWEGLSEKELLEHGLKTTNTTPLQRFAPGLSDDDWNHPISVENMILSEIETRFNRLCRMTHLECQKQERIGNEKDGGWNVCVTPEFEPKPKGLVYSFGINNDFSFDDMMASKYGSSVNSFDPSMAKDSHRRSEGVYFHNIGLAATDEMEPQPWKVLSLAGAMKYLGHENATLDMLKFDIEYGEFEALHQMLKTGILRRVKQLAFELHVLGLSKFGPNMYKTTYAMLLELEIQGFRRFRIDVNTSGPHKTTRTGVKVPGCCYEMYYVNLKYISNK